MDLLSKLKSVFIPSIKQDLVANKDVVATPETSANGIAQQGASEVLEKALYMSSPPINGSSNLVNTSGYITTAGTSYTFAPTSISDTFTTLNIESDTLVVGSPQFSGKAKLNSKVTLFGKIEIISEVKVPNKFIQWIHKKFFNMEWKDISCIKCPSKLSCLVNKTFESNCKIK